MNLHLTYSILGAWFIKFAHKQIRQNGPTRGISFYIGLCKEMHLKLFFSWTNNPYIKEIHTQHPLHMICKVCALKYNLCKNCPTKESFTLHRFFVWEILLKRSIGIQVTANQGVDPFWDPERGYNRGSFGHLKIFLSQTTGPNALIFGMNHPWTRRYKFAQIKFPWSWMAPP